MPRGFYVGGVDLQTVDEYFMSHALSIAGIAVGQSSPNPPVGAVVVKDGQIVGQGVHLSAGGPHAEVHALHMAGIEAQGSTLYVTLEPCNHHGRTPPCTEAIIHAGVSRVVVGSVDPNPLVSGHGLERLRSVGVEVTVGVQKAQTDCMNEPFFHYVTQGRPFVVWKCAATLDGYIAACNGQSNFVTGVAARAEVQELRKEVPAIAVGIGTVLADNPRLTVRDKDGTGPKNLQPKRIVFDSKLRMPLDAALLHEPGQSFIITTKETFQSELEKIEKLMSLANVTVLPVMTQKGRVSLRESLSEIAKQCGVMTLLLEGGSTLVSAFFLEQLVDKVVYYIAPKFLGGGMSALNGRKTVHMDDAVELERVTHRIVGNDICVEGYPVYKK